MSAFVLSIQSLVVVIISRSGDEFSECLFTIFGKREFFDIPDRVGLCGYYQSLENEKKISEGDKRVFHSFDIILMGNGNG